MIDPNEVLQSVLQRMGMKATPFPPTSRYHGIEIAALERPDGTRTVHLRRRFLPQPGRLTLVQEHEVKEGDRLDNLAAEYFGDPELFWRICDANAAIRPNELIEVPGRRLSIALPEAMSGTSNG